MRHFASFGLTAIVLAFAQVSVVKADAIPYGGSGENATTYTFTAAATGNVTAYFAGSQAGFTNDLGLLVNGVDTNVYGLNNHASAIGASIQWAVTAGDHLTFVMRNLLPLPGLGNLYSNPALNGPYDGGVGHNHIYSTAYTATTPLIGAIPIGTYVGFEDLPAYWPPDWNYTDETFVFTNVATTVAPLPSTAWVGLALFVGLGIFQLSRRSTATA